MLKLTSSAKAGLSWDEYTANVAARVRWPWWWLWNQIWIDVNDWMHPLQGQHILFIPPLRKHHEMWPNRVWTSGNRRCLAVRKDLLIDALWFEFNDSLASPIYYILSLLLAYFAGREQIHRDMHEHTLIHLNTHEHVAISYPDMFSTAPVSPNLMQVDWADPNQSLPYMPGLVLANGLNLVQLRAEVHWTRTVVWFFPS